MILLKIESLPRYEAYLEQNAREVAALYQDIFIHVTHFFREPETFSTLQRKVLPKLIANRPKGEPLRVWVPGCSTGEEAYSMAITLLEFLEKRAPTPVQVFGTDISAPAVDIVAGSAGVGAAIGSLGGGGKGAAIGALVAPDSFITVGRTTASRPKKA